MKDTTTWEPLEPTAKRLNLSVRQVRRLLQKRQLPGIKLGRDWRISKADLDKWLERQLPQRTPGGE